MRMLAVGFLVSAVALDAVCGGDAGGLSFDFKALSAERFGAASGGTDIAKGVKPHPAYGFVYDSGKTDSSCGVPEKEVKKHVTWKEEGDERVVTNGEGLLGVCRGDAGIAAHAMSSWETVIPLPDEEGGMYRVAFDYKMNHTLGTSGSCIVRTKVGFAVRQELENCDSEWKPFVATFPTAKGEKSVQVNLNFAGVGTLRYRGLSVVRETAATRVVVTTCVHGQVDKSFAVGAGQVGCITYMWKRRFGEPKFEAKDFTFRLRLPKGFSFVAATWAKKGEAKVTANPDGSSEILLPRKGRETPTYSYRDSNWTRFGVLVKAAEGAPEGNGSFEVLYRGETVSNVEPTRWFTIAPVRVAAKPKRYRNGFFPGSGYGVYDDAEASFAYAKMASDAGADWWIPARAPDPELLKIYRRAGISIVTPQTGGIRDGYVVHGGSYVPNKDIPASDRYVARAENPDGTIRTAVCPMTVIKESPFFVTNTLPNVRKAIAGCDGIWANWEPFNFVNQGCMCERCRRTFAKYLKIDERELTHDIWWNEVKAGGKYAAENRRFRSIVHARMVRTIDRYIREMTGGEGSVGFIPGIAWCEMSQYWRPNDYPVETKAIDYAGHLKWMDPWGPYPFWNLDSMFTAAEGFNVVYWFAAKDVREQVNRDYPLPNRPKLMSFPQGAMACEWITEPEWLGLGLDSFFFNGWEASVVYFFPKGYDARYWRSFAEATDRAAKYEDFVFDGRRCDGEVTFRTPGFNRILKGKVSQYLPFADVSLVQYAAYEKDGRLIVAVLNFADDDSVAVEISHPKYGRLAGCVPAARCRVFELSEARAGKVDNLVLNPDFARDDFGKIRAWSLRDQADIAECEIGQGPEGSTALRLALDKGRQFIQPGLRLAYGEPYRLSLDVRSKGFPKGGVEFMVRNPRWNRRGPKIYLPGDTDGAWRHVTATGIVERAQEDSYYVSFYLAKPTPGASLEIARPRLEPLSEKARLAPRSPEPLSAVRARVIPIDPLLADLDADNAAMTWYYGGFLSKPEDAYRIESSMDGGPWKSAPLTAERRVRLAYGRVEPGRHAFQVRIVANDGSFARTNAYEAIAVRHGLYPEGRRLNNFVTELLAAPLADGAFRFASPRKGYVYFDLGAAEPTAEVRLDAEPTALIAPGRGVRSEAVRMLEAGEHTLVVTNASRTGLALRVHAVRPVPHHGSSLHRAKANVKDYLYGRDFYDRFLPMFYTEVGAPRTAASRRELPSWLARKGAALTSEFDFTAAVRSSPEAAIAKIRANGAFDEGLDVWLDELGVIHPRDDHVNLGETLWRIQRRNAVNVWWADAIRGWFADPATYATEISGTVNSGEGRGSLYAEVYPAMLATEEATYAQETNFIRFADSAAKLVPAAYRHTTFCFSGYIAPEGWNTYPAPEGDYKVFFDHFMHRLAADPAFAGAGGIGSTAFQHIDEEQVRFIAKAIRHYALEGRTDSLAERFGWTYAPGHLGNCDFAEGLKGWTAVAAEPGSVAAAVKKGYGFDVQFRREVPKGYGDTVARLTRSAKGPNLLKQTLTGLKPGAYYILSYHSTDEADVDKPGTPCRDFVLRAELKGATVMPKLSFDRRWPEDLNDKGFRSGRPNDLKAHPLACQHRYVFRADGPTAELTVSDWASETEPGAPVGRTRLVNYFMVRPYYLESEAQRADIEEYLTNER